MAPRGNTPSEERERKGGDEPPDWGVGARPSFERADVRVSAFAHIFENFVMTYTCRSLLRAELLDRVRRGLLSVTRGTIKLTIESEITVTF